MPAIYQWGQGGKQTRKLREKKSACPYKVAIQLGYYNTIFHKNKVFLPLFVEYVLNKFL